MRKFRILDLGTVEEALNTEIMARFLSDIAP